MVRQIQPLPPYGTAARAHTPLPYDMCFLACTYGPAAGRFKVH